MTHITKAKDPVDVIMIFKKDKKYPYLFHWSGKRFVVEKVNLSYAKNHGNGKHIYYSVTSEGNYFKLVFDTNEMEWFVEEVYSE